MENNFSGKPQTTMIICSLPADLNENITSWKEYRLDFLHSLNQFAQNVDKKTILTIREPDEGGKRHFAKTQKNIFYKKMIAKYDCLVDWEILKYDKKINLPSHNLVLSYHNFGKWEINQLENIIALANQLPARFLKLAIPINSYQQLGQIKKLIETSDKPVIWAGLGKLGKLSRALYKFLGAAATFYGLEKFPTAPNQLTRQEADKFRLKKLTANSSIGGIVGGEQVAKSLGLEFYNQYFNSHNYDAVYLPFYCDNFNDFWDWLQGSSGFLGFSITMPFKEKIAKKLDQKQPINLFLPSSNIAANTDIIAFQKALTHLQINEHHKILLWGYGGTATTFLLAAKKFKENIYVDGRNKTKLQKFIKKFNLKSATSAPISQYHLLVNCTPRGTSTTSLQQEMLPKFTKLIDLPYQKKPTELVQFCQQNSLQFVSGQQFWYWQAEEQLKYFIKQLKGKL
ncbi:MAG TPA: hypothetical protein DHM37_06770 [Candidatus Cloacimonas sp.]|nr:hypothetical protein [Candidatus Cloacimonas sp.]